MTICFVVVNFVGNTNVVLLQTSVLTRSGTFTEFRCLRPPASNRDVKNHEIGLLFFKNAQTGVPNRELK